MLSDYPTVSHYCSYIVYIILYNMLIGTQNYDIEL